MNTQKRQKFLDVIMKAIRDKQQTAREHAAADKACGREWVCGCAACRWVRTQCEAAE